ncbi:MAG: hypothetical protein A2V66_11740 [Ignavibacteria bacterium RBG_13_36_8]|nr:MAG: hypothetical protein A2V66_11740 [Ignavibacteria bacterium RBG_13_36_8]
MKIAILSDIHGNRFALEAVLKDIKQRNVSTIVNLGDCLYGPLDPAGTADILIDLDISTVSGNEDRILLEDDDVKHNSLSLTFTKNELKPKHFEWLKSLPQIKVVSEMFCLFHGTPKNDSEYLLHKIIDGHLTLKSNEDIQKNILPIQQPVILCGHDHTPAAVQLNNRRIIVNPGSVGCPAYYDGTEPQHFVENGAPHARYSIISQMDSEWKVENILVPYDWDTASRMATQNGRSDWARWLKTGRT